MTNGYLMLNASIFIRKVIMPMTVPRRTKDITTTLEATIMKEEEKIIKGITMIEDLKEEEETPQVIVKKIVLFKRSQRLLGTKVML